MRRSLLLPAALFALVMGVAGADPMAFARDQQASAAVTSAGSVEGGPAIADDVGGRSRAAPHREAGQTFGEDLTRVLRNVALLAIASFIFGLGAAGAKALWILDDAESTSHGWPRWFSP